MNTEPLGATPGAAAAIPIPASIAADGKPLAVSDRGDGPYIQRFNVLERTTHALVVTSFLGLVLTGVPLRFAYAPWAAPLMSLLGGPLAAGIIHRICGAVTFGYFGMHLIMVLNRWRKAEHKLAFLWGPRSMVPQPKDLFDVVAQFKWFLGMGPRPKFDRYSYMEKFDYMGVFWGVAIIGSSGLLLWFPTFFAKFLPGWIFNIATIVHGDEALLAFGFIFTIHFFNVHFRPEKFPIDLVIFTGRAREEYYKEEHPLEYERELQTGQLRQMYTSAPSRSAYLWSMWLGFASLGLGVAVIILVIYALIRG